MVGELQPLFTTPQTIRIFSKQQKIIIFKHHVILLREEGVISFYDAQHHFLGYKVLIQYII